MTVSNKMKGWGSRGADSSSHSSLFLLQPSLSSITIVRGEESSKACSSHSFTHLVNCFPSADGNCSLGETLFSWTHQKEILVFSHPERLVISILILAVFVCDWLRLGLLLCLFCQMLEKGVVYEIWLQRSWKGDSDSGGGAIFSCGLFSVARGGEEGKGGWCGRKLRFFTNRGKTSFLGIKFPSPCFISV